ncbi:hypothetical protein [Streptomyces griseoruber]|uniref:hypothetical protein n=1 Tax=Streptomyces griseoruber TaxID=1943 RepID=UPI000AB5D7A0|nr:hypothetical protein [Streptomyces griseoruber]
MADTWARFVEKADPNGGGLPAWPAFAEDEAMVFDEQVALGGVERPAAMRLLADCPRPL